MGEGSVCTHAHSHVHVFLWRSENSLECVSQELILLKTWSLVGLDS